MIALSITVHEHPRIISDMIRNVRFAYNNNAFIVVHVSKDSREEFFRDAERNQICLKDEKIFWNDIEIPTRWGNVLPMQVSNFLYLTTKLRVPFTHFQIISPANMIIGKNIDRYIGQNDVLLNQPVLSREGWYWNAQAVADKNYTAFRNENNLKEILCARVDGAAIRADIFADFVRKVLSVYSIDMIRLVDPIYPMEETLLPTYLSSLDKGSLRFSGARSKTFEPHEPPLTLEKVQALMGEENLLFLKRISPSEKDPIRKYILEHRA